MNCYSLPISLKSPAVPGVPHLGPAISRASRSGMKVYAEVWAPLRYFQPHQSAFLLHYSQGHLKRGKRLACHCGDSCLVSCCGWFLPGNSERTLKKAVLPAMIRGCG